MTMMMMKVVPLSFHPSTCKISVLPLSFNYFRCQSSFNNNFTSQLSRRWKKTIITYRASINHQKQDAASFTDFGGWDASLIKTHLQEFDSVNYGGWSSGGIDIFQQFKDYLIFAGNNEKRYITLFFLGFLSSLAISRFRTSMVVVLPVCIFLFMAGFYVGSSNDISPTTKVKNRKPTKSQDYLKVISVEKMRTLEILLNDLEIKTSSLVNSNADGNSSISMDSGKLTKLTVLSAKSLLEDVWSDDSSEVLADRDGTEMNPSHKYSWRKKESPEFGSDIIQSMIFFLQDNVFGSKYSKNNPLLALGSLFELEDNDVVQSHERKDGGQSAATNFLKTKTTNTSKLLSSEDASREISYHVEDKEPNNDKFLQRDSTLSEKPCPSRFQNIQLNTESISGDDHSCFFTEESKLSERTAVDSKESRIRRNSEHHITSHNNVAEMRKEMAPIRSFVDPISKKVDVTKSVGKWTEYSAQSVPSSSSTRYKMSEKEISVAVEELELYNGLKNIYPSERGTKESNIKINEERRLHDAEIDWRAQTFDPENLSSVASEDRDFNICLKEGTILLKEAKECLSKKLDVEAESMLYRSAELLTRATKIKPTYLLVVGQLGNALLLHGKLKLKISRELRGIISRNSLQINRDDQRDKILFTLSEVCEECEKLLAEAGRYFRLALSIDGNDVKALNNWGLALSLKAQLISDIGPEAADEADKVYLPAIDKFDAMISRSSSYTPDALFRWGKTLQQRSLLRRAGSKERVKLLHQARRLFEDALSFDSSNNILVKQALSQCMEELEQQLHR